MAPESASRVFVPTAKDLADAGQFSEAIKILEEGLKQYPKLASARVLLGEIYWTSGDAARARAELEQVTKAVPDNFAAHRKLALVCRHLGDCASAVRSCQAVLRANPKDLEMLNMLAELQPKPGKAALEDEVAFSTTVGLSPSHSPTASPSGGPSAEPDAETKEIDSETLAELYVVQGHCKKGLAMYRRLAAKSPGSPRLQARIAALESQVDAIYPPPVETPAAKREAHVRRLEGWLEVIRQRRRA